MNSEELELSLRTEFESYLKGFLADLRQEVSEFQRNFETEFEKHKSQTDEALRKLVQRFESGPGFDQAFNESVIEHLRLARDEGATITAVAIGEAEKLKESAPAAEFDKLRDAINEISGKTTQSEILKSLVDNASTFSPRGAFFIVKNEHFVGWRAFGDEAGADDATVRGIQFPMSTDTVLREAIETLGTATGVAGSHEDDGIYLDALGYGKPDRMYAIPLVARGRGVAVLYADFGTEGVALNPEALETLVRVAGLTVELMAAGAAQPAATPQPVVSPAVEQQSYHAPDPVAEEPAYAAPSTEAAEFVAQPSYEEASAPVEEAAYEEVPAQFEEVEDHSSEEFDEQPVVEAREEAAPEEVTDFAFESNDQTYEPAVPAEAVQAVEEEVPVERFGDTVVEEVEEVTYFEPVEEQAVAEEPVHAEPEPVEEYVPVEAVEEFPDVIEEREAEPVAEYVPHVEQPVEHAVTTMPTLQPVVEVATAQASRTKYRDRNMDLPIEVPEDERRLHNDARRFARLLVSEIKLYNEQKVVDGREAGDLYDRLREAIDRSRDMYDKRVQQPVAEKFDYFHYELVSALAEGEDVKLGASYPGSKVPA